MSKTIQTIRGMNDILPDESFIWRHVENLLKNTLTAHGYHEIRFPILEKTELFARTIGETSDIIEKEMYTFLDRNQDSLSLRPEGTASCVRSAIEHSLIRQLPQRLWYMGPFFRYERPQKGRCRQFHQCGAEVYGVATPDVDTEIILLSAQLLHALGLLPHVELQLNSLGSKECRLAYRHALQTYFSKHTQHLDEDSQRRLHVNPLRILDSKNPDLQSLIEDAPKLIDSLDDESHQHFEQLKANLSSVNVSYRVNPKLVRGLDYYSRTVFEWVTTELGAQGTVCAGGRYDQLIEQLGGSPTPAIGFALGLERVILLYQQLNDVQSIAPQLNVYILSENQACFASALHIHQTFMRTFQGSIRVVLHCGGGSLKNQFKKADKSGAEFALIIGEEERQHNRYALKPLRVHEPQQVLSQEELIRFFTR